MRWSSSLLPVFLGGILPSLGQEIDDPTLALTNSAFALDGTLTSDSVPVPTGDYQTYSSTITLSSDGGITSATVTGPSSMATESSSGNGSSTYTTTSESLTLLVGDMQTTVIGNASANATSSATPSASPVVNTQPCNGYTEFCTRKYSNITMVAAHNSPFIKPGNVAANQVLDVEAQLNDGIRMLQFQTHMLNDTLYLCHSSCDLLNVGPLEPYLTRVAEWISQHPYDVVTILMGNSDYVASNNFAKTIEKSGLKDMIYTPSKIPMALEDWPTLSSMILSGKRVVTFLDYEANQTETPWLMDEFSQMWETPFSPTDRDFPCTIQRPPGLSPEDAEHRLYMANHNLNLQFNFGSLSLLIPNTAVLNETNSASLEDYGSLAQMAHDCKDRWTHPPNFLLVDYYNYGNFNGSVFEVAAEMNNVTYNGQCCGTTSAASGLVPGMNAMSMILLLAGVQMFTRLF